MSAILGRPLLALLTEHLGAPRSTSASATERAFNCPWPHTKNGRTISDTSFKLAVNLHTGYWVCNVCRKGGRDPGYLLRSLGVDDTSYTPPPVPDISATVAQTLAQRQRRRRVSPPRPSPIGYPCVTYPIAPGTHEWKYLTERRRLSPELIATLRLCVGSGMWRNRIFFPVVNHEGQMTYWTARDFGDPPARNKYDTPDPRHYPDVQLSREYTIYRQYPFFGYGLADGVDVTEGALSAVACGPSGVALLGKEWSATQIEELLALPTPAYYVALDGDARKYAIELARTLASATTRPVLVVPIPDGDDPDSLRGRYRALRANALPHHDLRLSVGNP